jgi:hypothetical protein
VLSVPESKLTLRFGLTEQWDEEGRLSGKIEVCNGAVFLYFDGHGDLGSADGHGCPLMVELFKGEVRVIVWGDINQEDPTHSIFLKGAREQLRKEEEP